VLVNFNHIGMCLVIPKQVIEFKKGVATVASQKGRHEVGALVAVKKGDWVLTQNNVIVQKINKKQAQEINKLFKSANKKT
jgi:hydrogenase maturation factor